jgi:hypothetical protein
MKDRVLNWALLAAVCFVLLQFSNAGRQYTDNAFSRIKGVFSDPHRHGGLDPQDCVRL